MDILISRYAAQGDVMIASSIAAALKNKYNNPTIYFETLYPHVLNDHPFIDHVIKPSQENPVPHHDLKIDLNMSIEMNPHTHWLQAICNDAKVDLKDCVLTVRESPIQLPNNKYVVFHPGVTGWAGRDWIFHRWQEIANRLMAIGFSTMTIGSYTDNYIRQSLDYRNQTTVNQLAYLMNRASLFIGIDSFPFSVAQATNKTSVIFFGAIHPYLRIVRNNIFPIHSLTSECLGCWHRKPIPCCRPISCELTDLRCETSLQVDQVWETVVKALQFKGN